MNKTISMQFVCRTLAGVFFIFLGACSGNQKADQPDDPNKTVSGLLPIVKKTSFTNNSFPFKGEWTIVGENDIKKTVAYNSLTEGLQSIAGGRIKLTENATAKIQLVLQPGSVAVENGIDTNRTSIEQQAYVLQLDAGSITITANAPQGLYYGVQTFLQLIQNQQQDILLPQGEINDWPDLSLRMIYWDDAHHLEKFDALKRIILQASQYKINAFAIKLEGHFQFASAPYLIEPYALTAEQYQELTDYAKAHFVELVPYLDAPAHVSFILKHPQYSELRLYPNNNYEFSMTDTGTAALVKAMFNDLLQANNGGKYVILSTDEAYYAGKGGDEINAAIEAGSHGKLLARFVTTIADELKKQGRTVIFWGEYPLTANDIGELPSYLVTGEYNNMALAFNKRGIQQLIYTSTQGEEPIFPNYYSIHNKDTIIGNITYSSGRVDGMLRDIRPAVDERKVSIRGVMIAGWSDAGLHPETFWLGYLTGAAAAWNIYASNASLLSQRFFTSFYGRDSSKMKKIYELLSAQAEFYDLSWEWGPSDLRKPILGNSEGIFSKPEKANDQTIPLLPVPAAKNFAVASDWDTLVRRMEQVEKYSKDNDELMQLINENRSSEKQQYNWEVLTTVAVLCKQNLNMLTDIRKTNSYLKQAEKKAGLNDFKAAIGSIDDALSTVQEIKKQRDSVYAFISKIWYKEWLPLVIEANGRHFLFELDDIKDHRPGRTVDLSYLIYRQLNYPLGNWFDQVLKNRNKYAHEHKLPAEEKKLEWTKYE
jgi:hexosaminidase